ncbi:MAG: hypothetical protein HY897_13600 [Deltaproteobacteria bacterium]|nr:hypothetical protein [Deltaproteobacteria bacterium]
MNGGPANPPNAFAALRKRLLALAEPAMRVRVVSEFLEASDPEDVVAVLREAAADTSRGDQGADHVLAAFAEIVGGLESRGAPFYDRMAAAYATAVEQRAAAVCRLFSRPPPARTLSPDEAAEWDSELAKVTLGGRRALAKSLDRALIERLLKDPAPEVVRNLLMNPRVTESDIVALCARRPNTTSVLREIHGCPRWRRNYRVRLALARNPYTPTEIAVHAVTTLAAQDLRTVMNDIHLHEHVRAAARARLKGEPRPAEPAPAGRQSIAGGATLPGSKLH